MCSTSSTLSRCRFWDASPALPLPPLRPVHSLRWVSQPQFDVVPYPHRSTRRIFDAVKRHPRRLVSFLSQSCNPYRAHRSARSIRFGPCGRPHLRIPTSRTTATTRNNKWSSEKTAPYSLESAGEGGFRVSGEQHSLGDGDLSRFVTGSRWRLAGPWCPAASLLLILWSWLPCIAPCPPPATPSTGMPFSERNSSRSTYCQQRSDLSFSRRFLKFRAGRF